MTCQEALATKAGGAGDCLDFVDHAEGVPWLQQWLYERHL